MDPLYANYDKRKKTLDENSAPVPQPTPNSMPVFGAATAPTPEPVSKPVSEPEPEPEAELVIDHSPAAPEPAPEPIAAPTPAIEPTPQPAPVQNPFETQQQPTAFEQQFEQMVDGAAPAQLSQPQPQFNPNYTGTGDIVLNLDQPKKKNNTKIIAIIAGIVVVTVLAVVLIAMGGGNKGGVAKNNKQAVKNFIEYFVFGTEGENEVTDEIINGDPEKFAFTYNAKNDGYTKNLTAKIDEIKNNEGLKKQLETYFEVSKILDMNYMLKKYVNKDQVEEDGYGMSDISSIVKKYETDTFEYYKALDNSGCIDGSGKKDNECVREYSDEVKEELINSEKWHIALREQKKNIAENITKSVRGLR